VHPNCPVVAGLRLRSPFSRRLGRFGAKLDRYEVLPDGRVRAHFADGRTETADLLVAADGMCSTVRRQLLPDEHEVDLGIRGVIGRTMLADRFRGLVPGWSTMVVDDGFTLLLGKMAFRRAPREAAAALAPEVELPDTRNYVRWLTLLRRSTRWSPTTIRRRPSPCSPRSSPTGIPISERSSRRPTGRTPASARSQHHRSRGLACWAGGAARRRRPPDATRRPRCQPRLP
jgi:2-polyprenyl-6-methoxyphenol hydroxylase-like FAD-dependent oxidoreductase